MTTWAEAATLFQAADPSFAAWTVDQQAAHALWSTIQNDRMLLFYPTGKGKTKTSLGLMADAGYKKVLVVAPPRTHHDWRRDAIVLGMEITVISVERMRSKDFRFKRGVPIIVDEFHLLGRHGADGFKKLDRNATGFPAIILASATPEYNDYDRAYCVAHVMDPVGNLGGFQKWVYTHCETRVNPFASTPYVDGFLAYDSTAEWLVAQGYCAFIEDDAVWMEDEFDLPDHRDDWLETYGYDRSQHRMIASDMEKRHRRAYLDRVNPDTGYLWDDVFLTLTREMGRAQKPWLLFCMHATIAEAVGRSMGRDSDWTTFVITGETSDKKVEQIKRVFMHWENPRKLLVGTATLATGMDGLDKACDQLLIFDPLVGDYAKKRQLIGRVLDRGTSDRPARVVEARTKE